MIQTAGACRAFCQEEGMLLQKHCDRDGRCIALHFKSIGAQGWIDSSQYLGSSLFCGFLRMFSLQGQFQRHPAFRPRISAKNGHANWKGFAKNCFALSLRCVWESAEAGMPSSFFLLSLSLLISLSVCLSVCQAPTPSLSPSFRPSLPPLLLRCRASPRSIAPSE